ncbi:MAG: PEGA domain-containing protein, partial [bacterium]|nr:PEGA domain-containing protein [bacterium]
GGGLFDRCGNLIGMVLDARQGASSALSLGLILEEMNKCNYTISLTDTTNIDIDACLDNGTPNTLCSMEITTNPSGATIIIGGSVRGTTPAAIDDLSLGEEYDLRLRKSGYIEYSQRITCSNNDLNIDLIRENIRISSRPSGAKVFVDGTKIGNTPIDVQKPLPGITQQIRIEKEDYETFEGSINSSTRNVSETLESDRGRITVMYSHPSCGLWNVRITIGEQQFTPTGNPYTIKGVPLGEQDCEITGRITCPNGYCNASYDGTITLKNGASYIITWDGNSAYGSCDLDFTRR